MINTIDIQLTIGIVHLEEVPGYRSLVHSEHKSGGFEYIAADSSFCTFNDILIAAKLHSWSTETMEVTTSNNAEIHAVPESQSSDKTIQYIVYICIDCVSRF